MIKINKLLLGCFLGFCLVSNSWAEPYIVDTDMGVDDVVAILYLLHNPNVDIKAITVEGTGLAHCGPALRNLNSIMQLMKKSFPIACGDETVQPGQHPFPADERKKADMLAGAANLLPSVPIHPKVSAETLLAQTVLSSPEKVTVLAIGPLTNIASAIKQQPSIQSNIKMLYIMGGAISVPGNINALLPQTKNKYAEWNFYADPKAASAVFASSIPITLIPLDITQQAPVDMVFYNHLEAKHQTIRDKFYYALFKPYVKQIKSNQWYFWDPLAAVIAVDESFAQIKNKKLTVKLNPETQMGRTVVDKNGRTVRVCVKLKKDIQHQLD